MEFKLFTDLISALGTIAKGFRTIKDIPKKERKKYHDVMDETYRLINTTLNMVIIRLGDILQHETDHDFINDVVMLDNYNDWLNISREFRLCRSLRLAVRETETLSSKLSGKISTKDWDALLLLMNKVLATEGEVAEYISNQFENLANSARNISPNTAAPDILRTQTTKLREELINESKKLQKQEIDLFSIL